MSEERQEFKRYAAKLQDYKATFESAHGRRVLYDLMKACHMLDSSHVNKDPNETVFNEGERNVVLRILHFVKYDEKKLETLMTEGVQNEH